ncbi:MAG: uvrC [Rickettsiaceae bacterium]|nr:uvrC [Rickettsiaceae bacterium]
MKEQLKKQILEVTDSAGVYRFLDDADKALYVGKAKSLKKRLKSYLDDKRHNSRIRKMLSLATKIEVTTTNTESEALLLECNLIKKLMPRYNILLRDDKTFANILVDTSHPFPSISTHRNKKSVKGKYFGPFANSRAIYETIDYLKKSFLLRSCSDNEFKSRTKPCMEYQIKRCSAPCVGNITQDDYGQLIKEVLDFLGGKKANLQEDLSKEMQRYSDNLEFEKARILRDRIKSLSIIQAKQNIHLQGDENIDFVALVRKGNLACIIVSFFRNGNNYGSKPYFLNIAEDDSDGEIMDAFLEQFYAEQDLPNNLLISHETGFDKNIKISIPRQGSKFNLMQEYLKLAKEELDKKLSSQIKDMEMLAQLKQLLDLPEIPKRIEIYDNSHTSGQFAVGAFVVAGREGFIKNAYRKFSIRIEELDKKDDCSFLRQVLTRRFKKMEENTKPDLVIIDGGKGQLNAANEVFKKIGIEIPFTAMSKGENRNAGEEWFHIVNKQSFTLPKHSPLMHYLQRLRDEAHRFAIGFNRQKRAKSIYKSELDEIGDIGSKRKSLLLNHFGSVAAIKEAGVEDLMRVKGISKTIAQKIAEYFSK